MCVGSPQCVLKDRTCNGIFDCTDRSDEAVGAKCSKFNQGLINILPLKIFHLKKASSAIRYKILRS